MKSIYQYHTEQLEGKKVVICDCSETMKWFALRLLSQRIHFDYFLAAFSCEPYEMPCIFNKPVISIDECKKLSDYVIIAPYVESESAKEFVQSQGVMEHYIQLEYVNPFVEQASNIVVYGTGGRSKRLEREMGSLLNITHYCDSDRNKTGIFLRGKKIIHPAQLENLPKDTIIIIASTAFEEIAITLKDYHIEEGRIFVMDYDGLVVHNKLSRFFKMHLIFFCNIVRDLTKKQIVVYGRKEWVEDWVEILGLVGIQVMEKVKRISAEEDGTIYQLAYYEKKDVMFLLADDWSVKLQEALLDLDINPMQIILPKEYAPFSMPVWFRCAKGEKYHLDPNIGQIILREDEEIPGFVQYQYGDTDSDFIRILTLGGSTTTGYAAKHRPWSFFLSELLKEKKIPHIIYCAGVPGYIASQELLRLIRDGIWLKPDIVISYSGINNMVEGNIGKKNLFLNSYQEQLCEILENSPLVHNNISGNYYGINPKINRFDYWMVQMKIMQGICKEFGIQFKAFFQPLLLSKKPCGKKDADMLYQHYTTLWNSRKKETEVYSPDKKNGENELVNRVNTIKNYWKKGREITEDWFIDLSWIFDDIDGVYIDNYHVNETGNKIIAKRILEHINLKKGDIKI